MAKPSTARVQRQLRTSEGKADSRVKLMGAVRAACRRLGLDDDARRDLQLGVTGKPSMADMSLGELGKLLDRLNKDWKGPSGHRAHTGKIRALWWTCYWLGAVAEARDAAIDAFVRRQTGVSALRFLDHRGAPAVIEALKAMATREGVDWPSAPVPDSLADRNAVLDALWAKLAPITGFGAAGQVDYLAVALDLSPDRHRWSAHELDAAIKLLGKRYRRELDKAGAAAR